MRGTLPTFRGLSSMKSIGSRWLAVLAFALVAWLSLLGATAKTTGTLQPDKLVILSTTDVKGKVAPCG